MKAINTFTAILVITLSFAVNFASANVGTIVDVCPAEATATTIDNNTREIVRFEDVDPGLGVNMGCTVDYFNPTEQQARRGMEPVINDVIECPR